MEPKLIKVDSRQNRILIIVSLLIITLFIGTSYSLLSSNHVLTKDNSEEAIVFKTGELNLELTGDITLPLDKEYPKSDLEGKENKAIKLTFTNTGTIDICRYEVKLVSDNESNLDSKYLRYIVSENNEGSYQEAKNLDDSNIVYTGNKLKVDKSKTIYIKVWIDESAKDAGLSKNYSGSFEVDLYQGGCGAGEIATEVVKETITAYAESSKDTFAGGLVAVNTEGDLYNETDSKQIIREYRYSGPNVNNYVIFNDEEWRIVGVFKDENGEEHIKIVRNDVLLESYLPEIFTINGKKYSFFTKNTEFKNAAYFNADENKNAISNDWATAGIQYWLNDGSNSEASPNNGYLSYLSEKDEEMINETKYYLGSVTVDHKSDSEAGVYVTTVEAYNEERAITGCVDNKGPAENTSKDSVIQNKDCRVWADNAATWTGKIGLLYSSDVGYSTTSNNWNIILGIFPNGFNTIKNTSWIYNTIAFSGQFSWLISPAANIKTEALRFSYSGNVSYAPVNRDSYSIRPSLYLKSNVEIISGNGSQNVPYLLSL